MKTQHARVLAANRAFLKSFPRGLMLAYVVGSVSAECGNVHLLWA